VKEIAMRPSQLILSTVLAAGLTAVVVPARAASGIFYDPRNPASPTGKTIGYELFRTIGCPGRELLGKPCPEGTGPVPPVASTDPATTSPSESAAATDRAASDRAALAGGGTGATGAAGGTTGAEPAPAAALAAGDQTGASGGQGAAAGTLVLEDVNFDFDKATLRPEAIDRLEVAANMLTGSVSTASAAEGGSSGMSGSVGSLPDSGPIEVAGHADSTGPAEYNMGLSLRRANAVRDYLVSKGVAADRLVVRGYGESQPTATNETREGRAKNRRVELLPQR
jgi:OOP family OmpA-OmpF porin